MAEGGDNDGSSGNASTGMGPSSGPNLRGGPSSGATKLTDTSNNSGLNSQSCQC